MLARLSLFVLVMTVAATAVAPTSARAGGRGAVRVENLARHQTESRNPLPRDLKTRRMLKTLRTGAPPGEDILPEQKAAVRTVRRGLRWQDRGTKKDRRAYAQLRQRLRIARSPRTLQHSAADFFRQANRLGLALVSSTATTTPDGTRHITLEYSTPVDDPRVRPEDPVRRHEIALSIAPGGERPQLTVTRDMRPAAGGTGTRWVSTLEVDGQGRLVGDQSTGPISDRW